MSARQDLLDHLGQGVTTVCRAWLVSRKDGVQFGFTDHDRDLSFEGHVFKASSGMTARTLQQTTGMAVDNSETVGALSDAAVEEVDLIAGRFDGAEVRAWLVNWADATQRIEQFRGNLGEISRAGGAFKAELRGLTDKLNQAQGRIFQRNCTAVLGDARCTVDLAAAGNFADTSISGFDDLHRCIFDGLTGFSDRWFERGRFVVTSGDAAGLVGVIKFDRLQNGQRVVDLWHELSAQIAIGDQVRLEVGCDRTSSTCRAKFANFANFRGFPHIPGDDWLASYPVSSRANDGGSLGR
ncbi:MAG: DUF2163 domain-containing protein [Cypionkella sp.]|uniref:DUF2163 domain-containing protein n=1 Tax=Cypionkella sp. TaxID=2811411 RepID=UPI002ABCB585|nr:DUF2163 domain-containing protein [Cypionkella sp.]MDZ4312529.1 DUF2163 domain-containing protein [Cypionkella sp.]MDZ4393023.1 DUF2163 domain-containing protein [Cypionkella sp.]